MGISWTKEQEQVIKLNHRNILVSASAGSGKTAVLVERIVAKLDAKEGVDIDGILVATYTEAAAAEMRERIQKTLEKKLEEEPENEHLQRQLALIYNAAITTIHGFCLSVIKEYFHTIDLEPGFRIGEEGELRLLRQDVMVELLEKEYAQGDIGFLELTERFATGRDDKSVEAMILSLYEYSKSYPQPKKWIEYTIAQYVMQGEKIEEAKWFAFVKAEIERGIEEIARALKNARKMADKEYGPYMYVDILEEEEEAVQRLKKVKSFEEQKQMMIQIEEMKRTLPKRNKEVDEEIAKEAQEYRKRAYKKLGELKDTYFLGSLEEMEEDIRACAPVIEELMRLVEEFSILFAEKKAEKNIIDFNDMEHFALSILTEEVEGQLVPSQAAKEYQKHFAEVMVDEYQDSNYIQEEILKSVSGVSEGRYNMFMVGDVKQSIYKFRLSRPELFVEKFNTYTQEEGEKQRIDLSKNFRSRRQVLESANFIFEQIMTKELGNISYDEKAALYVGAQYEEREGMEAEVLLIDTDQKARGMDKPKESKAEIEMRAVAKRIKELRKEGYQYGEMVILGRSIKSTILTYTKILTQEEIPVFTEKRTGYFETIEVAVLLNYLRVLDNARQDIALAAVLTSFFGGFTSEELARFRIAEKEKSLYDAMLYYKELYPNEETTYKIEKFLITLERFREILPYTAIHEVLWQIMETGYEAYILAMPLGEQKQANLEMLVEKAKAYEKTSYKGLFNFVRYIEQLQKYEVDYGEANLLDEHADVVRIMSIHKSKGLEFKVVFVVGTSREFNMREVSSTVVLHPDLGVGIDVIDLEKRTKAPTLLKKVMQAKIKEENLGEELRVLYVALTRAKEKLIVIGTVEKLAERLKRYSDLYEEEESAISYTTLIGAKSYSDWIIAALIRNKAMQDVLELYGFEIPKSNPLYKREVPLKAEVVFVEELLCEDWVQGAEMLGKREELIHWETQKVYDEEMEKHLQKMEAYAYPYDLSKQFKMKFTVSELKKQPITEEMQEEGEALYKEEKIIPFIPSFIEKREVAAGAFRGSAYHKVLELLDLTMIYDKKNFEEELEKMRSSKRLEEEMAQQIKTEDFLDFLNSEIGKRMRIAELDGKLKREQPFVIGMSADEIYQEKTEIGENECILVQGIIDGYFEEENEWVVIDYKTDRVKTEKELANKYKKQLDYYAKTLEQLTDKKVKEKIIYSFTLRKEIRV